MSVFKFPPRLTNRSSKVSRRAAERGRRARIAPVELCEERLLMTGIGIPVAGQLTSGSANYYVGKSLAPAVGFVATTPVLSNGGTSISFGFDNTAGTGPITVDVSTYLDTSVSTGSPLASQVLETTQQVTLAKGQGPTNVVVPIQPCTQIDAFIENTKYNGATVGSEPIAHFAPIFDTPGYTMFAAPSVDAGYNTTGFIPTLTNSVVPTGTLGTLLSYALTDDAGAAACPTSSLTGSITTNCNGTSMPLGGQTVTLTGNGPAGPFTLTTTSSTSLANLGAYSFTVPYADLSASNLTVSVPVTSPTYLPGTASAGTVTSLSGTVTAVVGGVSITPTSESIANIPINFGAQTASNYNFVLNLPSSISGIAYNDATGNGLGAGNAPQAGDTPLVGATVILTNTATNATVTTTTGAGGAYTFTGLATGNYTVSESKSGQTSTGPNGNSYSFSLNSCQNLTGYNFSSITTCLGGITNLSYTDAGSKGITTFTDLGGNTHEGDQVTANFTVTGTVPVTVTLVTYTATDGSFDLTTQKVFQDDTETLSPGNHSLTVTIPDSYYQIDFVCGTAITAFNPANNDTYHGESRFIDSDNGGSETPTAIASFSSLSGTVYLDTTGKFATDSGLAGVIVTLTGTDVNKQSVTETRVTGANGSYSFQGLQQGTYKITETTPSGYVTTMDVVGTAGGTSAATATNPNFNAITLAPGVAGSLYNFGVNNNMAGDGSTATSCFWTSCQGTKLIDSFNGSSCSTAFGKWLAAEFPHLGSSYAGQSNQQIVCDLNQLTGWWGNDLSAQLLDTALSIYATSSNLAGGSAAALAAQDGFTVTANGSGSSLYSVGTQLACYGGPTGNVSLLNLLLFVDSNSCQLNNWNFDCAIDNLFSNINQVGGIGC